MQDFSLTSKKRNNTQKMSGLRHSILWPLIFVVCLWATDRGRESQKEYGVSSSSSHPIKYTLQIWRHIFIFVFFRSVSLSFILAICVSASSSLFITLSKSVQTYFISVLICLDSKLLNCCLGVFKFLSNHAKFSFFPFFPYRVEALSLSLSTWSRGSFIKCSRIIGFIQGWTD